MGAHLCGALPTGGARPAAPAGGLGPCGCGSHRPTTSSAAEERRRRIAAHDSRHARPTCALPGVASRAVASAASRGCDGGDGRHRCLDGRLPRSVVDPRSGPPQRGVATNCRSGASQRVPGRGRLSEQGAAAGCPARLAGSRPADSRPNEGGEAVPGNRPPVLQACDSRSQPGVLSGPSGRGDMSSAEICRQ